MATQKRSKARISTTAKSRLPKRLSNGEYAFADYPEFRPNLSPRDIFRMGSFGGTYWRPIRSNVTRKNHRNQHHAYPKEWWYGIPNDNLTRDFDDYDPKINKYGVRVGTTLREWEAKRWINRSHPYGWVHWYCDFFLGKRGPDDARQVGRWVRTAGPNSRFRLALINRIRSPAACHDHDISPKIRQTLQHWAYRITTRDCKRAATRKNTKPRPNRTGRWWKTRISFGGSRRLRPHAPPTK